jgi:hypothetical protein
LRVGQQYPTLKRDTPEMPLEAVKQGKKCLVFSSH